MQLLNQDVIDSAFQWLIASSDEIAMARGNVIRTEFKMKKVHARLYLQATGTIESKKAQATTHPEYEEAVENYAIAMQTWERAQDQRNRAELVIEAWRTASASERAIGRVTR